MTDAATPAAPARPRFDWEVPTGPILAEWFDGERAAPRRCEVRVEGGELRLIGPDGGETVVEAAALRRVPDQARPGRVAFGLDRPGAARLVTDDPRLADAILLAAPEAAGPPPLPAMWRRALAALGLGAAILALLVWGILPGLARVLSHAMGAEAEVALGQLHFDQTREFFGGLDGPLRVCDDPAGLAALDRLTERVAGDVPLPYDLDVVVLDDAANPILNAYAVAGGRVTFFDTMIQEAERPEEIAAVLAHEVAHVVHKDPVRGMLQASSATALMALLAGDVTGGGLIGGAAGQAVTAGYSRGAEAAADEWARARLAEAGLPPSALGRMFERLRGRYGDVEGALAHFSTHPELAGRIALADAAGDPPPGAPALAPKDWQALRGICG